MGSLFEDKVDGDPPAPVDAGTVTVANPWKPDELQYVLTEVEFQTGVSKLEVSVIEG